MTCALFVFAGLAEIGGGWLVWQTVRNKKPWYYLVGGFAGLMAYGLIPTLQPEGATFSRVYAVYGVSSHVQHPMQHWQRMPDEGPDLPLEPAPVEELVYDEAPERLSDAEDQ
uniref:Uncharacterized protein n=1 Tax=Tetradesmus obliquus TaxID=3088 RepID=A0A383VXQ0_TETOB|eukprot:jgi/Sobl393_1/16600/SZX70247.1